LNLWQESNQENYYKRVDSSNWIYIVNTDVYNKLIQISNINDTVILYSPVNQIYFSLNSQNVYSSKSLDNIYSSYKVPGSWMIVYLEANSELKIFQLIQLNQYLINKLSFFIKSFNKCLDISGLQHYLSERIFY